MRDVLQPLPGGDQPGLDGGDLIGAVISGYDTVLGTHTLGGKPSS